MTEQPKEYIPKGKGARANLPKVDYTHLPPEIMAVVNENNDSTPPEGAAPVPDSTRLIEMAKRAHTEWKNREERRGIHNEIDWCCGWMAGFLSMDKPDWVKAQAQAAREEERKTIIENLESTKEFLHGAYINSDRAMKELGKIRMETYEGIIESLRQPTQNKEGTPE